MVPFLDRFKIEGFGFTGNRNIDPVTVQCCLRSVNRAKQPLTGTRDRADKRADAGWHLPMVYLREVYWMINVKVVLPVIDAVVESCPVSVMV